MAERERKPQFYIEKGYEVTKLLKNPTSQPRILEDTYDPKTKYFFNSDEQRKQLRSTALLCLDVINPCALVVTSNEKNAFPEKNPQAMSFLKFIGYLVRYDLFDAHFYPST